MATTTQTYLAPLLNTEQIRFIDRTGVDPGVATGYPRAITSNDTVTITIIPTQGGTYVYTGGLLAAQAATGEFLQLSSFVDETTLLQLSSVANDGWWSVTIVSELRSVPDGPIVNSYTRTFNLLYDSLVRCRAISCYVEALGGGCGCGCDGKELTAFKVLGHLDLSNLLMAQGNAPKARQAYNEAYTLSETCDCGC